MIGWIKTHKIWALIIFIPLAGFALGGMELTMQPFFCASCHEMDRVYVTWHNSPHAEVACIECHSEPGTAGLIKAKLESLKSPYYHFIKSQEGIDELLRQHTPTPDSACLGCHREILSVSRVVNIVAPHKRHYALEGADCQNCHVNVGHLGALPENDVELHMLLCLDCHEQSYGTTAPQREECEACHVGEHEMHLGLGGLEVAGIEGPMPDLKCSECHTDEENFQPTKQSCIDCHEEEYPYYIFEWQEEVVPLLEETGRKYRAAREHLGTVRKDPGLLRAYEIGRQNYLIVDRDGSKGVHNKEYTVVLLRNAAEKFDLIIGAAGEM